MEEIKKQYQQWTKDDEKDLHKGERTPLAIWVGLFLLTLGLVLSIILTKWK